MELGTAEIDKCVDDLKKKLNLPVNLVNEMEFYHWIFKTAMRGKQGMRPGGGGSDNAGADWDVVGGTDVTGDSGNGSGGRRGPVEAGRRDNDSGVRVQVIKKMAIRDLLSS
jgi:hypothetical protein